jgi:chemosensory pili system protein ChpA (sensor histidine kinase/response regulator)
LGTEQAGSERLATKLAQLYGEYDKHCAAEGSAIGNDAERVENGGHTSTNADAAERDVDPAGRPPEPHSAATAGVSQPVHWLRVPAARVDDLCHVVSELMINRTALEQNGRHLARSVESLQPVLEQLRAVCRDLESRHELSGLSTSAPVATGVTLTTSSRHSPDDARLADFDELEFDRYTGVDSLSHSCAEATNGLSTLSQQMRVLSDEFDSLLARQDRLTRGAQARLFQIRMVPFGTLTQRLRRALREVAASQGKSVELDVEGEETELDKIVLEEMADPLLHLLRNAVDHGVESTEERQAKGKPATAMVRISVAHHGTQVVIRIVDDGKGIDAEKIRQAIVTRGDVDAQRAPALTPEELYPYIFVAGFSTASHVTEISGRGVGMDIVHSRIEKLKGRIDVRSCAGQGTTFTIRLPVTLAITPALIVEAGHDTFAIPMQGIVKIVKAPRESMDPSECEPRVNVDGDTYPVVYLPDHLGLPRNPSWPAPTLTLITVASADRHVAIAVDQILLRRDIVVKPLGDHLGPVPGLIGATVLGDGSVVPILDPADLAIPPGLSAAPELTRHQALTDRFDSLLVMVVDDSVSVRHVTSNLVQRAGWKCVTAKDGADALELLDRLPKPPDVFLLDVEMPRMDGFQLLSALRQQPQFAQTPIIMITSRTGEKHRQTAFRLGATQFVAKPVQEEELVNMIRGLTS